VTPRVVLAGASGHGRSHLREIVALEAAGRLRLVGVCEVAPLDEEGLRLIGDRPVLARLPDLLAAVRPDVGVVATPMHTHVPLARHVLDAGAHLLLEKPPAPSLALWRDLLDRVRASGRVCQVGFQSLGSAALDRLTRLVRDGAFGRVRGIGVRGAWSRPDAYYRRAPWAGRRVLDGAPVVDGALTNPFAHGIATALAVDGSTGVDDVAAVELELLRAHDIEADDTSCLRLRTARGTVVVVAVTLCARTEREPVLVVHGEHGRAELHYTLDRLVLDDAEETFDRITPLANLLAHLADPAVPLRSPLEECGGFTRVLDAVRASADPLPIGAEWLRRTGDRLTVVGVESAVTAAVKHLSTFAELDVPWSALGRVARTRWNTDAPPGVVVRPALHPVRTLGGTVVTAEHPADHPWHRGIGLALPDVDGVNLWGGPSYRPGRGYVAAELGRVRQSAPGTLEWCDPAGAVLLRERREVRRRAVPGGWELRWRSVLSADREVRLDSPGSLGRAGAGYGGWFWRLPDVDPALVRVLTPHGSGQDEVNGTVAERLVVVVDDPAAPWTAVLSGPSDPWFVRVREYRGIGSALCWDRPRVVRPGADVTVAVRLALYDGVLTTFPDLLR
jgi:predicted dehydrogenase